MRDKKLGALGMRSFAPSICWVARMLSGSRWNSSSFSVLILMSSTFSCNLRLPSYFYNMLLELKNSRPVVGIWSPLRKSSPSRLFLEPSGMIVATFSLIWSDNIMLLGSNFIVMVIYARWYSCRILAIRHITTWDSLSSSQMTLSGKFGSESLTSISFWSKSNLDLTSAG